MRLGGCPAPGNSLQLLVLLHCLLAPVVQAQLVINVSRGREDSVPYRQAVAGWCALQGKRFKLFARRKRTVKFAKNIELVSNSVKFEAEKLKSTNSQEHLKGKATVFSMNHLLSHLLI